MTRATDETDTIVPPFAGRVPRCIGCSYTLIGLTEFRCPECGRPFHPDDPTSYTFNPPFLRWRYWMPGLLLALGGGLALYAVTVGLAGFGWATTLVVPFCAGALLGYGVRVRWLVIPLLAITLAGGLIVGLISLNIVGVFCGLILAGIATGPLLIGSFCGFVLRQMLKHSRFDQRWHLPTLLFILLPIAWATVEHFTWTPPPAETVRTTEVIAAPADRAWDALMFYEQVKAPEPALFRWRWLGLPRPLYTAGRIDRVGDRKVCVYDKGRLVKQATERAEGRRLAFKVVEQGFERHAMKLVGGSFDFEPVDATHTRVTLETTYVPHLGPRWCWRWSEQWTVHTLHRHVLHGMAIEADAAGGVRREATRVVRADDDAAGSESTTAGRR